MWIGKKHIFLWILVVVSAFSAGATGIVGVERYYDPLDKLASNPVLLSRNKEAPTSAVVQFPFSMNEYQGRMQKLAGCTWDASTAMHLGKLTGVYADRMFDAMGMYAELQSNISAEFRKQQLNENYQLLAPMLSGMNVHYVSPGGKRGPWQLDIVTAVRYGLTVSDLRDDRDDPILAAAAAAAYLKDLQNQFRAPEVVLWAYISSPAEVRRAFARAESPDPKKAADFLPEYLKQAMSVFSAWSFIWAYTDKDNLPVFTPAVFLPYENAITSGKTHLGQISEMLEISLPSLRELNPSLKKSVAGDKETIHLPQGYASRFLLIAEAISKYKDTVYFRPEPAVRPANTAMATSGTGTAPLNSTVKKYHKVKPGETLSQLAQKYHVSVSSLKKWNHLSSSGIRAGQKIVVQVSVQNAVADKEDKNVRENIQIEGTPDEKKQDTTPQPPSVEPKGTEPVKTTQPVTNTTPAPKPKVAWTYYTVRSGDTLSSIGRKYGVPYTKIKEWNGLRSDSLKVGQKLKIKR